MTKGSLASSLPFTDRCPKTIFSAQCTQKEILAGAEQRLRDFLIYRFGGPQHYIEQRGHPQFARAPFSLWIDLNRARPLDAIDGPGTGGRSLPGEAEQASRILRSRCPHS